MGGVPPRRIPTLITDFVDVDSEKWRQYGKAGGLMGWLYRLEGRRLAAFEREHARRADHTLLVTKSERECFLGIAPDLAARVHAVPNGVDTDYFSPEQRGENPFNDAPTLVFVGAMDYRPNIEAVLWFAREIFPRIREREPETAFCIVGLRPTPAVEALAREPGISVTGRVPDVRPYVGHAAAVVAPLTIARGVQNKVLEAMAMAKAIVCTPQALEGIGARHGKQLFVASDPKPFVEAVLAVLQRPDRARELGNAAQRYVREHHGWGASVAMVEALLAQGAPAAPVGAQLCCANGSVPGSGNSRSTAALLRGGEGGKAGTAEGRVQHTNSLGTHPDWEHHSPVGAVSDRETARSAVRSEGPSSAPRALSRSETAPTGQAPEGEAPKGQTPTQDETPAKRSHNDPQPVTGNTDR